MFPTSGPRESPQSGYRFTRVKRKLCFFMVTMNMSAFSPKARSWMSEQWIGFNSLYHITLLLLSYYLFGFLSGLRPHQNTDGDSGKAE